MASWNFKYIFYSAYDDREWSPLSLDDNEADCLGNGCFASGYCECCGGRHHGRARDEDSGDGDLPASIDERQRFGVALCTFQEFVLLMRKYRKLPEDGYASVIRRRSARRQRRCSKDVRVIADALNELARTGPIRLNHESLTKPSVKDVGLILDELEKVAYILHTRQPDLPRTLTPDSIPTLSRFIPNIADRAVFCLTLFRLARPFSDECRPSALGRFRSKDNREEQMRLDLDQLLESSGLTTTDPKVGDFIAKYCK